MRHPIDRFFAIVALMGALALAFIGCGAPPTADPQPSTSPTSLGLTVNGVDPAITSVTATVTQGALSRSVDQATNGASTIEIKIDAAAFKPGPATLAVIGTAGNMTATFTGPVSLTPGAPSSAAVSLPAPKMPDLPKCVLPERIAAFPTWWCNYYEGPQFTCHFVAQRDSVSGKCEDICPDGFSFFEGQGTWNGEQFEFDGHRCYQQ